MYLVRYSISSLFESLQLAIGKAGDLIIAQCSKLSYFYNNIIIVQTSDKGLHPTFEL